MHGGWVGRAHDESVVQLRLLAFGVLLALVAVVGLAAVSGVAAADAPTCAGDGTDFADGDGAGNPYEITNAEELQCLGHTNHLGANAVLTSDVDASGTSTWNGGDGFDPIGDQGSPFTGTFNGDDHTISGLTIDRGSTDEVGLFGEVGAAGTVQNVGLEGGDVSGDQNVGVLVGSNEGTVENSYATVSVSGLNNVGGLVGYSNGPVRNSYSTGSVSSSSGEAGGLVGYSNGPVNNSYATGSVSGGHQVGGLVGNIAQGTVSESYATGSVSGDGNVGGLAGSGFNAVSDSYWDTETTGQDTSAGGTNLTTSQMQGSSATTNMSMDFPATWESVESGDADAAADGYPILSGLDRAEQLQSQDVYSPAVSSITRSNPSSQETAADSVDFTVTFSESVSGVDPTDFTLTTTGTATTANGDADISVGGQSPYTVTVDNVEGDGDLRLDLIDDDSISDSDGDTLAGSGTSGNDDGSHTSGESFTIDNTAPSLSSFDVSNPSGQDVQVSFESDEQLTMIEASISGAESASLSTSDFGESGSGPYTYTATYSGGSDGTYDVALDTARDAVGNDGAGSQSGSVSVSTGPSASDDESAPVADAGSNKTVEAGTLVEFDGSNSSDDIGIERYEWDWTSDGDTDHGGRDGSERYNTPGTYEATLTVIDHFDKTDTDSVTVIVTDDSTSDETDDAPTTETTTTDPPTTEETGESTTTDPPTTAPTTTTTDPPTETARPSPTTSPSSGGTPTPDDGGLPIVPIVGGVVVVGAAGALGYWWYRT